MGRAPLRPLLILLLSVGLCPAVAFAQDADAQAEPPRLLGIMPNYRTSPTLKDYKPLTPRQKFRMARDDSFDRGTFALAAIFGAQAQWTEATPSFGHGVHGYARYYTASLSDFVIGDFMTESVFPTVLRQDPRYFRRGTGGGWSRFAYAIGQIVWTHTDAGGAQFNFSEVAGNATAVGISNACYADNRTLSASLSKLGVQLGVDAAANVLKEFAPEIDRLFSRSPRP